MAESDSVADARRRAEQARAKLWASIDELLEFGQRMQEKLEPSHLARDAWDAAKSKGADLAEDAVDAVRKRPVAATSAVAALALFIAREPLMDLVGKMVNSKTKSKVKKAPKPRKERVEKVND
jgi:type I site-specific restriction endonuclease